MKCYPSVLDVPDKIDLAVFTLRSTMIPRLMEECGRKGVKNVVIVSGGFKELGGEYAETEDEVVKVANRYGIRVIGPNCIGVFDGETRLDTFFQSHERMVRPPLGPIAFITQSGTFGVAMLEWAASIGISKFVSIGNRADVDEADLIGYLKEDPQTHVIALYVEGFRDGRKFLKVAREVVPKMPILILKAGRTEQGSRAAMSHTGSLAGSYDVSRGAFKQFGLIEALNFEELFDMTKALALQPPAEGNGIAMITNGAGPCVMAADALVERGLQLAVLERETSERLEEIFPPPYIIGTSVDLTGSATSKDYERAIEILAGDKNVDVIMPFFVFQDTPLDEGIVKVVIEAKRCGKPIVCGSSGGSYTAKQSQRIEKGGIPVYPTPERTVAAAHSLVRYGSVRKMIENKWL
jgi:3-hydroxypropionyl-CoA synthetase (ADP-forming)